MYNAHVTRRISCLSSKETVVAGVLAKAKDTAESLNGYGHVLQQCKNHGNPKARKETAGSGIWKDTDGLQDILVRLYEINE